jgi:putative sterol carrier protein
MLEDLLEHKTTRLNERLQPLLVERAVTHFQFYFTRGEPFHLTVAGRRCHLKAGTASDPDINLFLDCHQTCWDLLEGQLNGMQAFLEGKYRSDGNIVLSQLLLYLFDPSTNNGTLHELSD